MKADGKGWLFTDGLLDGPLPSHYQPYETPVPNLVYPDHLNNPVMLTWNIKENPHAAVGSPDYPHVITTYRLTSTTQRRDEPLAALAGGAAAGDVRRKCHGTCPGACVMQFDWLEISA